MRTVTCRWPLRLAFFFLFISDIQYTIKQGKRTYLFPKQRQLCKMTLLEDTPSFQVPHIPTSPRSRHLQSVTLFFSHLGVMKYGVLWLRALKTLANDKILQCEMISRRHKYFIRVLHTILREKKKVLITNVLFFSNNVLTLSQRTNFRLIQTERVCRRRF